MFFCFQTAFALLPLTVILTGQFVYGIDQNFSVFRICVLVDAVAEVEYMAAAVAVVGKDARDFGADRFGRTEEGKRVEVALQGNLFADATAGFADVTGPVQA